MFALALYDKSTQEIFLVRDRIGKKPLSYWLDGENLVFASELKPIMECPGFTKEIRRDVLARFLLPAVYQRAGQYFLRMYISCSREKSCGFIRGK